MQALLVGLVAFFGYLEPILGTPMIQRPIVLGPLTGLVLGDYALGLQIGAVLELAFMGSAAVGAALPPDITSGGVLGTALAIASGAGAESAVALALPIATLGLLLYNFWLLVPRTWMLHMSDGCAARGDADGVARWHWISCWSLPVVMAAFCGLAFWAGSPLIESALAAIPAFVKNGLTVATGILPALGFALLGNMLVNEKVAPYFFAGFLMTAYLGLPVLGVACLGVVLVVLMLKGNALAPASARIEEETEDDDF